MKLHISNHAPDTYSTQACGACDGSGYYDDEYDPNRSLKCHACHGTGLERL